MKKLLREKFKTTPIVLLLKMSVSVSVSARKCPNGPQHFTQTFYIREIITVIFLQRRTQRENKKERIEREKL